MAGRPAASRLAAVLIAGLVAGLGGSLAGARPAAAQEGPGQGGTAGLPFGGAERLVFEAPAGWTAVQRDERDALRVLHLIPEDQDPAAWRDMIAVQVLKTPQPPPLGALHDRAAAGYEADCERSLGGGLQSGETNGYETGFWTLGCSRNTRSGLGETAFFKAMRGLEGIYIVQRAWRTEPFDPTAGPGIAPDQQRAAIALLQQATVCIPDSRAHPCP
ncbi:hypothetical protein [Roseospira goensis]|uniref:Uncharacterized protein n=1 Tax=Roseospira goensis TaxID=391922 RepID=A0A7W6WLW4_9PROT|nr:hypothetical protein [Roseospira goensis]MBB4287490.1 hypothetical protein [Roseospira goensis]